MIAGGLTLALVAVTAGPEAVQAGGLGEPGLAVRAGMILTVAHHQPPERRADLDVFPDHGAMDGL